MAQQPCPNFQQPNSIFFVAQNTNCACFLRSPRGESFGKRGKLCERTHHDSGTLFVHSFFISRGESLLKIYHSPSFSCGRKFTSPWLYCRRETGNSKQCDCCLLCSDQKMLQNFIFWRSHWRIAFYPFQFQVITFGETLAICRSFSCTLHSSSFRLSSMRNWKIFAQRECQQIDREDCHERN